MLKRANFIVLLVSAVALLGLPCSATVYGGVDFPGGAASFADAIVSYDPVINAAGQPTAPYRDATRALGIPDYGAPGITYVTLGSGGSITLRFTDNSLTGSDSTAMDLWIFEIGPDVEDTFVEIGQDGVTWNQVGKVYGSTSGIDIDAYGFHTGQYFSYVRLTDDPNEGDKSGATVGADIDAVGAISSAPPVTTTPEPATFALLGFGLLAAGSRFRR